MRLNKIYKKNCIGRVPSSIRDLEECALCENEDICMSLMGGAQVVGNPAEEVPYSKSIEPSLPPTTKPD